jgi:hypothetical protein
MNRSASVRYADSIAKRKLLAGIGRSHATRNLGRAVGGRKFLAPGIAWGRRAGKQRGCGSALPSVHFGHFDRWLTMYASWGPYPAGRTEGERLAGRRIDQPPLCDGWLRQALSVRVVPLTGLLSLLDFDVVSDDDPFISP